MCNSGGIDFESFAFELEFSPPAQTLCSTRSIPDDAILEGNEEFTVELESDTSLSIDAVGFTIADDEGSTRGEKHGNVKKVAEYERGRGEGRKEGDMATGDLEKKGEGN